MYHTPKTRRGGEDQNKDVRANVPHTLCTPRERCCVQSALWEIVALVEEEDEEQEEEEDEDEDEEEEEEEDEEVEQEEEK